MTLARDPLSLEFLSEPAFLLEPDAVVVGLNGSAQRMLGGVAPDFRLTDYVDSPHEAFADYLRRSRRSTSPIVGSATLRTVRGATRMRLNCARLPAGSGEETVVLRCLSQRDDRFAVLERRLRELDDQLRARLREKAILEDTLRNNRALLRELQHRVKNNIQTMASLMNHSAKRRQSPEVDAFVDACHLRLLALASIQDAVSRSAQAGAVGIGRPLQELVTAVGERFGLLSAMRLEICDAYVSSDAAHALALIANELTTNALRHGLPGRDGKVRITFGPSGEDLELVVHDCGPGMPAGTALRSSGLGLVRALCRQIGATLEISADNGARCAVRLHAELDWRPA